MKKLSILFCLVCFISIVTGQQTTSTTAGLPFASFFGGIQAEYALQGGKTAFLTNKKLTIEKNGSYVQPNIQFGGLFFWGYGEASINLGTTAFFLDKADFTPNIRQAYQLNIKAFPLRLGASTIRPFIGASYGLVNYKQKNLEDLSEGNVTLYPLSGTIGVAYRNLSWYANLEYRRVLLNNAADRFISTDQQQTFQLNPNIISLGFYRIINYSYQYNSGRSKVMHHYYNRKNEEGLYFLLGPGISIPIFKHPVLQEEHPVANTRKESSIYPELGIGYNLTRWDFAGNVSFRPMIYQQTFFDTTFRVARYAVDISFLKFFSNFYGFSPYISIGGGMEFIRVKEENPSKITLDGDKVGITPYAGLGFEYRQNGKGGIWSVRSGAQYAPLNEHTILKKKIDLRNIDIKLFQVVFYPRRLQSHSNYKWEKN